MSRRDRLAPDEFTTVDGTAGSGWRSSGPGFRYRLRFRAAEVYRPPAVADRVSRELIRYGHRHGRTLAEVIALIEAQAP